MVFVRCGRCGKIIAAKQNRKQCCPECKKVKARESYRKYYDSTRALVIAKNDARKAAQRAAEKQEREKQAQEAAMEKARKETQRQAVPSVDEILRRAKPTGLDYGWYVAKYEYRGAYNG